MLKTSAHRLPAAIGIVGAGTIGPDIGYYLLSEIAASTLTLIDIDPAALTRATARIAAYAAKGAERGKLSRERADAVTRNLRSSTDYADLAGCDWVIEAATENLALKQRIFAQIEAVVGPQALITSNTSSLPAARMFAELRHPGRATVTHFFAPAFQNPVVELVDWDAIDRAVLERLRWVFAVTGKVPMVTADRVCFMLDRIFDNWCNESGHLLSTASAAEIDQVAREFVQAGPFFVLNLANGNPIIVETNTLQAEEEGGHYTPSPVFSSVERWRTLAPGKSIEVEPPIRDTIRDRLLGILFSQAIDLLDKGIGDPSDLELGCRLAFGFKQGPLALMHQAGEAEVDRILGRLQKERPGMPMRRRALSSYTTIVRDLLIDDVEGIRIITIRRPEALNALHDGLNDEILAAIREIEADPVCQGFVITGYGTRAFCAGADIGRFPSLLGNAGAAAQYARDCSRLLLHLDRMDKPVVAALNGMALGGGLELAIRAHGIVAVPEATLQFPEITLGIVPGIGAMVVPYRRWPEATAMFDRLLRSAARITAVDALRVGVVDQCVPQDELLGAAMARVRTLSHLSRRGLDAPVPRAAPVAGPARSADGKSLSATILRIMDRAIVEAAAAHSLAAALEIGYRAFGDSACAAASREGIDAFRARRAPDFDRTG